jgi:Cytochrome C oxidase, cbb3-type, subunit III
MKPVILITVVIVFYSCRHPAPESAAPANGVGGNGGGPGSRLICFQTDILPIFQTNCATSGCHDATSAQKGYILDSYTNLFKKNGSVNNSNIRPYYPENSDLYRVLFRTGNDKMPPVPDPDLTTVQKNIIARWISEGAQNTVDCSSKCDSNEYKFAANIKPLLQNYCTGCHSGANPPLGVNLTTYAGVHDIAVNGLLYGEVAHLPGYDPMPKGTGKLSDCELAQIRKWVEAGSLNN